MATATIIPELAEGQRLDATEFERRYHASAIRKAELIEGVVRVASPVSDDHSPAHARATGWLFLYETATPGTVAGIDGTICLDRSNQVQPDIHLRLVSGGRSTVGSDRYIEGPPELVIEIAVSTSAHDLGEKRELYRRFGVREYLVWRVIDGAIDWFALVDGRYDRLEADGEGIIRSRVFPGLWLDVAAMIANDRASWIGRLQRGLASPEHAAFVAR